MVGAIVHVHVCDDGSTQTVLGKHALYNLDEEGVVAGLNVLVERLFEENLGGGDALSAGIAGVAEVFAVGPLLAGEAHFVGVDDDDIVATHDVGRIAGLVFAAEDEGDGGAKATENLVGSVDYHPLVLNAFGVGRNGLVA